ncbi:MAG: hypothetical protein WCK35_10000 [Chloroflexota bacterium]
MITYNNYTPSDIIKIRFLFGVFLGEILVALGWVLNPKTSILSIAAISLVLIIYGLIGFLGFKRIYPEILSLASVFGLVASTIFASEILLEYAFLPKDNTNWGIIEFGSIFVLFFLCGLVTTFQSKNIKHGILAAVVSALLSSIVWLTFILLMFYLFRGTIRQELVFTAEGNFEDFARSGMNDFNTFVMEDFLGAGFFHLLLSPLLATILGTLGGLVGKGLSWVGVKQKFQ